jgi:hypothetical protein
MQLDATRLLRSGRAFLSASSAQCMSVCLRRRQTLLLRGRAKGIVLRMA